MTKNNKQFILSDGNSINSKGYKINIDGIVLDRFKDNPIMLYEHDTTKVIGRWKDIEKKDNKLIAVADFDLMDEEASLIAGKVERGFLNATSIGLIVKEQEVTDNELIVTKCELFEASIVSIPADAGAVRLYNERLEFLSFSELKQKSNKRHSEDMYKEFYLNTLDVLDLTPETNTDKLLSVIKGYVIPPIKNKVEEYESLGIISQSEKLHYNNMLNNGQTDIILLLNDKKKEHDKKKELSISQLFLESSDKIITYLGLDGWDSIQHLDTKFINKIVNALPDKISLAKMLDSGIVETHDLDWYRKYNPLFLRDNPSLYQTLLQEKKVQQKK